MAGIRIGYLLMQDRSFGSIVKFLSCVAEDASRMQRATWMPEPKTLR